MEIFSNTILKFILRQGSDTDRKKTLLVSGEPAFTTDTNRLFVGTGTLSGGVLAGNLHKGSTIDLTLLSPSEIGDTGFDSDKNKLYAVQNNDGSLISDWNLIGGVYNSGNSHLSISDDNTITLNPLSANALSNDLVTSPLYLNSGRLALSANLPFQYVSTKTITISSGLQAYIDGVNVTNTAINTLSSNIVIEAHQIYGKYDGLSGATLAYSKNLTVDRLSAGHYNFLFGPLINANYVPVIQIYGEDAIDYTPRVIYHDLSSCQIKILSGASIIDANVLFSINP